MIFKLLYFALAFLSLAFAISVEEAEVLGFNFYAWPQTAQILLIIMSLSIFAFSIFALGYTVVEEAEGGR